MSAPAAPVRIVVADDHQVVRTGFAGLLGTAAGLHGRRDRRGRRGSGARLPRAAPDVVLMDVRMPGIDGIEATRQLTGRRRDGRPRVLILTTFDLDEYVYDALRAGASGFLLKDVTAERLFDAVRVVAAGEALLAPTVTRRLISEFARQRPAAGQLARRPRWRRSPRARRGPAAGRRGAVQPGDRRPPRGHRGDREDPRQPGTGASSGCATGPRPWSPPTRRAWSFPAPARRASGRGSPARAPQVTDRGYLASIG